MLIIFLTIIPANLSYIPIISTKIASTKSSNVPTNYQFLIILFKILLQFHQSSLTKYLQLTK